MEMSSHTSELLRILGRELPTRDALACAVVEQRQTIEKKSEVIAAQQQQIALLEERVRLLQAQRYGRSSEQSDEQLSLFDDPMATDALPALDSEAKGKKKKRGSGRQGFAADIPRQPVYLTLDESQKAGAIDTFFVKVKEELDITRATVQVLEYWQEKAVFIDDGRRHLVEALRPRHPLGKAAVSIELLAYLVIAKYADGLPLYRLEGILKRYGGSVSRTTLAQWLIRLSQPLQGLVNLLRDEQLSGDYLQGDETRLKVLKEPGLKASSHKWMWIMRGGPPDRPVVLFDYDRSRGKAVALRLLEYFEGNYFQSDGYSGYEAVCQKKGITHLGCWDHARRKFVEAEKAQPVQKATSKAAEALSMINALYRIEREMKALSSEDKYRQRQQRSVPALNQLHRWLQDSAPKLVKGGKTRDAVDYTLNQWPKLIRYCEHGDLNISNILAENAIRPLAVGRKAWLFCDTPAGARASAVYFSLIETAKANGLQPYDYLSHVIRQIPYVETVEQMEALLPWHMK